MRTYLTALLQFKLNSISVAYEKVEQMHRKLLLNHYETIKPFSQELNAAIQSIAQDEVRHDAVRLLVSIFSPDSTLIDKIPQEEANHADSSTPTEPNSIQTSDAAVASGSITNPTTLTENTSSQSASEYTLDSTLNSETVNTTFLPTSTDSTKASLRLDDNATPILNSNTPQILTENDTAATTITTNLEALDSTPKSASENSIVTTTMAATALSENLSEKPILEERVDVESPSLDTALAETNADLPASTSDCTL